MVFRIEDTDKERSKKEYEQDIIDSLSWMNISHDDGPYRQSERNAVYKKYIEKLIKDGCAYVSKEIPEAGEEEKKRSEVIRFRNPNKKIEFEDLIRGKIEFDTTELGDFVIARSIDEPLYHLTVVIDDFEMKVTHIIRGDDGISNTPRQILIQEGIGAPRPVYAHLPLILAKDKSKLSGRHGAVSVMEYRNDGFMPEALTNYLALLGWNPGTDKEIFTMEELIKEFSIEKIQKSGAIFDLEKLRWFNREYLMKLDDKQFTDMAIPYLPEWLRGTSAEWQRMLPLVRDKVHTFRDVAMLFQEKGDLHFTAGNPAYPSSLLLWKKEPDAMAAKAHLEHVRTLLGDLDEASFAPETIKDTLWAYAEEKGRGNVLWPLRVALTGQEKSPDPFISAAILGKEETLKRIDNAISIISK